MLMGGFVEGGQTEIALPDISRDIFVLIVEYLFTGEISLATADVELKEGKENEKGREKEKEKEKENEHEKEKKDEDNMSKRGGEGESGNGERGSKRLNLNAENVVEIFAASNRFDMPALGRRCERYLIARLEVDNVLHCLSVADSLMGLRLKSACLTFICLHHEDVRKVLRWQHAKLTSTLLEEVNVLLAPLSST